MKWFSVITLAIFFSGCSTLEPAESLPSEEIPKAESITSSEAMMLKHPDNASLSSLEELFSDKSVPNWNAENNNKCTQPIMALKSKSNSNGEFESGMRELIHTNPTLYHWCFYGKMIQLERSLSEESFILEKQALFVNTFKILAPISKAFLSETLDSRYYRYSISRYQQLSERIFFKKIEVLPEVTEKMVQVYQSSSPKLNSRTPASLDHSVLKKHDIDQDSVPLKASEDPWTTLDKKTNLFSTEEPE